MRVGNLLHSDFTIPDYDMEIAPLLRDMMLAAGLTEE